MSQSSYSYFIPNCFHQLMEIIRIMRIYADLVAVVLLTAGQERCLRNLLHCNGLLKNSAVVMPNDTAIIRPLTPSSASMFLITWYLCTSSTSHARLPLDEFSVELTQTPSCHSSLSTIRTTSRKTIPRCTMSF